MDKNTTEVNGNQNHCSTWKSARDPPVQQGAEVRLYSAYIKKMASPIEHEDSCEQEEEEAAEEPKTPKIRDTPEDIKLEAIANTIAFHPSRDILAAGDIDGDLYLFSYSCTEGENRELWSSGHHLKSCRKVLFSADGQKLFSVSKDKAVHILDAEAGKLLTRIPKAHNAPINALLLVDENIVATGDDEGTLKVWDMRRGTSFMDLKQHEDYISDITIDQNKRTLLTASGDGTMGVFNIRRRRFELLSEFQNGDLNSVCIMKRGRKVVCGSGEGKIYIFNWNGFGATSDRFAVQAEAVSVLPNRVLGSVGQHLGESIEEIARSRDTRFLASCAHDQLIKFWDISSLPDTRVSDYRRRKKKDRRLKALSNKAFDTGQDFFAGLLDSTEENRKKEDEEEEEEEEEEEDSDSGSD
ncbi:hypothetical protein cypCar_00028769 [Cyprinus carpio]|nr:hypothetical protein cypCar_00028769 [Cyprinus carpio]